MTATPCPSCGREVRVNADGLIALHGGRLPCIGSGVRPDGGLGDAEQARQNARKRT